MQVIKFLERVAVDLVTLIGRIEQVISIGTRIIIIIIIIIICGGGLLARQLDGEPLAQLIDLRDKILLRGLEMLYVPLLIAAFLKKGGRPHLEPEYERVALRIQIALAGQQIEAKESIVAPALAHLKVAGKLSHNAARQVLALLMQHFHAILVL